MKIRLVDPGELDARQCRRLRALLDEAYDGDFGDEDWAHARAGRQLLAEADGAPVGHAAIVGRTIRFGGVPLHVGYVEAVAARRDRWRQGIGTALMRRVGELLAAGYPLGMLSTGEHAFYSRLGWERWRGPSYADGPDGRIRTPDDDDGLMILRTPASPALDPDDDVVADWRTGDVW